MEFPAMQKADALDFFSEYGKMIYNPTGIFYWTGRSKDEAKINATIGTAIGRGKQIQEDWGDAKITMCIPSMKQYFPQLNPNEIFPYAPEAGVPAFRQAWQNWLLRKAGSHAERLKRQLLQPVVVPGITGAISVCTRMFVDPGAPIIVPDKRWENYDNIFLRNVGVTIEEFPAFAGQDFNLDGFIGAIQRVWEKQNRAVAMLNFPNNPTGYCPPKKAAAEITQAIQDLVKSTSKKLVLIFDDAYEGYVYDADAEFYSTFYGMEPQANFLPVKLDGISKELLWYGARIGMINIACPDAWFEKAGKDELAKEIDNKFRGVVRNTVSNCSMNAQQAALKALQDIDQVLKERQKTYDVLAERYHIMKAELAKIKTDLLIPDPFQGGFFCFVNLNPKAGLKAFDVCDHLLKQYKCGTVPIEQGEINGIRLAFCGVEAQDIPELCQSLEKAVLDLVS
ncbi:MAG: aminotransferase class I/II-fold pyridoxal phosphate-dependent enzyme [Candidatus Omnitrophota bacterium]|jgi:aspartate/methionine/tyrosine aminotransferase|nr:MAG: aminotransferase class I/II-fold pyridoxal phosphate-dependent enzyme [Candidatus Omnitrophota bacterium]